MGGSRRLRLNAYGTDSLADDLHLADPTELRARFAIEYPDEIKRSVVNELIDSGSVTVLNFELTYRYEYGSESREFPRFIEGDDGFYRIHIDERKPVERDWWEFYLDHTTEDPPASAEAVSQPVGSLSELDRRVLEAALQNVYANRDPPVDVGANAFGNRGPLYHDHIDADRSELVPKPPFEYVQAGGHTFLAKAERGTATPIRSTFSSERVATSRSEYEELVRNELIDVDFSTVSLSEEATTVLEAATFGEFHEEHAPMSDGLEAILSHFDAAEDVASLETVGSMTDFQGLFGIYRGTEYRFELTVYP